MKTMSVSGLKTHLSAALKSVQAGEPLTVMDRSRPVAILSPYQASDQLPTRAPERPFAPTPPGIRANTDALAILMEDRNH